MEAELSVVGLDLDNWCAIITANLGEAGVPGLVVSQVASPPGALGAGFPEKAKVVFDTVVGLATVVAAAVALYSLDVNTPAVCQVSVQTDQATTVLTYDCKSGDPVGLTRATSKLVAESLRVHIARHGYPHKVMLRPLR
jgi:hypothetical protein